MISIEMTVALKKTRFVIVVAACFLACATGGFVRAITIIDLDLSSNTAANSGSAGNGSVGAYDNGSNSWVPVTGTWEDRNATGNPAGRAYDTGANGSGSLATNTPSGIIYWGTPVINALKGKSTFSLYAWVKPDTLMNGGRILNYNNGELQFLVQKAANGVMQLQLATKVNGTAAESQRINFGDVSTSVLGDTSIDEWVFIGLSFDNGVVSMFAGQSVTTDLTGSSVNFAKTALDASATNGLVLLNDAQSIGNNRPFDGSLGGFYLSDGAMDSTAFEAVFDAQKSQFLTIPEVATLNSFTFGLCALSMLIYRRKLRSQSL